ncbi:MAG: cation:dicarboxylase symporter family transporter [Acidobacteriaceae bacterium]
MKPHRILLVALLAAAAVAALCFAMPTHANLLLALRWLSLALFTAYAIQRRNLANWIFVAMLLGAEFGHDFPHAAKDTVVLSKIFLNLIKVIIAPLIFSTLVVGIAGHADLKKVGRMGIKALLYFEIVTTIALFIGLAAINWSKAGVGMNMMAVAHQEIVAPPHQTASDVILHIFPENIAKSVAEGQVLQVVVFSILFAIALAMLNEEKRRPMLAFCDSLAETMFKFTNIVMLLAPVGVFAAIAYTVGAMGLGIMVNLGKLLLTLYLALIVFAAIVLVPVAILARLDLRKFLKAIAKPTSIAFATASSEAAFPSAMESLEAFGIPRGIVAFILPTGYSFNLAGSALYLTLASIFVAQAAGIHRSFGEQMLLVFTLMLTSKGIAGVPRAMLVILLATAPAFHLPMEPIFLILAIDQLMDMGRTAINVAGNCLATAVIARWEGDLGKAVPSQTIEEREGLPKSEEVRA